ncbi:MAG: hypothetical protein IRZ00_10420 [Gemmatimonadetes bacterium]|nr:hypothetical protein [Gemmatimonadota bacterium]
MTSGRNVNAALVLIILIAGAYLAAHVASGWLARRFLIVSGAEYLLLGILLGPHVSRLITPGVVGSFAAFMTLALGWVGAVVGAQFYVPDVIRIRGLYYRVAFVEAILVFVLVSAAMAGIFSWFFGLPVTNVAQPALALGAIAVGSAPSGIGIVTERVGRPPIVQLLQVATAIDAVVAIVAFGLLVSIMHAPPAGVVRAPTPTEWAVISIGIGLVGGALFHLFLGEERSGDRLFIALAGAIILASGAAAYLRLSPLLPTMLIGMVLVNTSRNRDAIRQVLSKVERPLYFVLLIFAGTAWTPAPREWILPAVAFIVVRAAAQLGAAYASAEAAGVRKLLGAGWGRALLGQGGLAIAIALNYRIDANSFLANIVFSSAIASVLLTDVLSARVVASVVEAYRKRVAVRLPGRRDRGAGTGVGSGTGGSADAGAGTAGDTGADAGARSGAGGAQETP